MSRFPKIPKQTEEDELYRLISVRLKTYHRKPQTYEKNMREGFRAVFFSNCTKKSLNYLKLFTEEMLTYSVLSILKGGIPLFGFTIPPENRYTRLDGYLSEGLLG